MNFLPIEMWDHIFSFLTSSDILNSRTVCKQWNTISLATFKWSKLNIGFRNNEDVVEFFEMMKQSAGGLKFCNFFLKIQDHSISAFNLTELSKEIGSYATSYYFSINRCSKCKLYLCVQHDMINIMLNATPNLQMLYIYTEYTFPEPNFHPLKQLEELHLKKTYFRKKWGLEMKKEVEVITNWIMKAPSLKKVHSYFDFESSFQNSSEMSKYFQLLKGIPKVCLYVNLSENHERLLEELQLVPITELRLQMINANKEACRALYIFLEKQSASLRTLYFKNLSGISHLTLTLPFLPKLETLYQEAYSVYGEINVNFSPFGPKKFICLQKIHLHRKMCITPSLNPFVTGEYPTVAKLVLEDYSTQNWKKMFPKLRKLKVYITELLFIKDLLADLPTDNYIVLCISDPSWIDYLIDNPFPVARLGIDQYCAKHYEFQHKVKDKINLWNAITGHARIEKKNICYIRGVNDISIPLETGNQRSIADIKNLWKLKLYGNQEVLKGIAHLSQQGKSFVSLTKIILHLPNEFKVLYSKLNKLSNWNFNVETRYYYCGPPPNKKMPEIMINNILSRCKKYATFLDC